MPAGPQCFGNGIIDCMHVTRCLFKLIVLGFVFAVSPSFEWEKRVSRRGVEFFCSADGRKMIYAR